LNGTKSKIKRAKKNEEFMSNHGKKKASSKALGKSKSRNGLPFKGPYDSPAKNLKAKK
jgi:hypothetical protein